MGEFDVDNTYEGAESPEGVKPAYLEVLKLENFEPARPVALEGRGAGRDSYAKYALLFVKEAGSRRAGASALVYKVMNVDKEYLALKRLRPMTETGTLENDSTLGRSARDAFDEEYRTQLDLSNLPCFPEVFGRGTVEEDPVILMEWVEGETLESAGKTLRTEEGPGGERCVPASGVAALGVAVLGALQLAGRLNRALVHRDISPRNIMLRTDRRSVSEQMRERSFAVCLIDFGSSTLVHRGQDAGFTRRTGEWRWGTPEYASPEMLTNHIPSARVLRRDQRVDVYALCSVLYWLYSGHTPYRFAERGVPDDEFSIVKEREAPYPLLARSPRDRGLVEAIMAGIRAEQSERIGVSELSARLVSWLAEQSPDAPARAMRQTAGLASGLGGASGQSAAGAANLGPRLEAAAGPTSLQDGARAVSAPAARPAPPTHPVPTARPVPNAHPAPTARPVSRRAVIAGVGALAVVGVGAGLASLLGGLAGSGGSDSPAGEEPSDNAREEDAATGIVADGEADGVFPAQGEDSELWGFARRDGSWWVEPVFSQAPSPFCEGLACTVDPNGRGLGYLDETGAWAIEPQFFSAGSFSEGLAAAKDASGLFGYVDASGDWAIEPAFDDARPFHEGLAAVSAPELNEDGDVARYAWGYVRQNGSWAIQPVYYDCTSFSDGLAAAATGAHSWQLVDEDGKVLPGELPGAKPQGFSAGLCALADPVTELWGYVDTEGSLVIEQQFSSCCPFVDMGYYGKFAPAKDRSTGLWGIIDRTGAWVKGGTPRFVEMGAFSDRIASNEEDDEFLRWLAPAKSADGNLWGFVDCSGNWIVEPQFVNVGL